MAQSKKKSDKFVVVSMVPFSGEYTLISKHSSFKAAEKKLHKLDDENLAVVMERSLKNLKRIG